jgi:phosphatidylserine/phosphatidylglycerophosphate/cardiolipin synthase-like enzyme
MGASLVGIGRVAAAIGRAHDVAFSAYVLRPGALYDALQQAARNGAHVTVSLQAKPFADFDGSLAAENRRLAAELAASGASVRMVTTCDPPLHMKAAVADGVAFLDDRNWPADGANSIVETADADDVAVVASALAGAPRGDGHLETVKAAALEREAALIFGGSGDRVDCESEAFSYSRVMQALGYRARHGAHVRLIVNDRDLRQSPPERVALDYLARVGVEIRVADADEKLCVAGREAWLGSANASGGALDTIDWGMRTRQPELVDALAARFEGNWARGRAYRRELSGTSQDVVKSER